MHTLSPALTEAILAQSTAQVFLLCATITHPDIDPIRLVMNTEPLVRGAGTYVPCAFDVPLPDDTDEVGISTTMTVDNTDLSIIPKIRGLAGVPKCVIELVLASQPDVVDRGPFNFSITACDDDLNAINLQLGYEEDFLNQAAPGQTYNPTNSRGLYL